MIDIQVPEKLAFEILQGELRNYRLLYVKDAKILTAIHIDSMDTQEGGSLTAKITQVEVPEDTKDDLMKHFKKAEENEESIFYDINLPASMEDPDDIHRTNGILLQLVTIFDTAEVKITKDYDTQIKIK